MNGRPPESVIKNIDTFYIYILHLNSKISYADIHTLTNGWVSLA